MIALTYNRKEDLKSKTSVSTLDHMAKEEEISPERWCMLVIPVLRRRGENKKKEKDKRNRIGKRNRRRRN
jgi:hypothetical protein